MKRVLLLIICALFCSHALSQTRASGNISDVAGNPLPGAIVTVYNNDKVISYAIAQDNGAYDLKIPGSFTNLDFYLMGYKRTSLRVDMKGATTLVKDVVLEEENLQLPTITVKPVAIKVAGDTVTYDANTFVRKEDNSLQEVLNRLPHVQVTTTGQVKVQGVNVNKVYIEDMDLLGGRYGLAIKNIRPEDISAVSVYYEHQPIRALEGLVKSNQAALNIKLKEKAKNRWIWTIGGHIGLPDILYQGKVTAMNFGSGRQTMAIAKTDNSGEDIIMETRTQNLQPGAYRLSEIQGGGQEELFPVNSVNLPVPKNYYYNNKSNAVSVNNLNKLSADAALRQNVVFFSDIRRDEVYTKSVVTPADMEPVVIADPIPVKSEAELLKEAFLEEKRMREAENTDTTSGETAVQKQVFLGNEAEWRIPVSSVSPNTEPQNVHSPQAADKWQQLQAIYPHIRPFEDRREYLLMRPQDFVILPQKYYSLSDNSFLLHGYYNYDHLILSKENRPEGEKLYIGVPGNFYDKEKQVAIMFGFESFEGKQEPARIGDFGYYMIPVEI